MGNQACCDDTKGAEFAQRPHVELTHPQSSRISRPMSHIIRVPDVSDPIRDHLDANRPFHDRLSKTPAIRTFGNEVWQGPLDQNGLPAGYGKLYKSDGALFIGEFVHGRANGPGRYIFRDGSYYEGDLKNNMADTNKGYYYSDGLQYKGAFRNNVFHGHGVQKGPKHEFEGIYDNGRRVEGTLKWDTVPNNNYFEYIYKGRFDHEGRFTGQGKLQEIKGQYEGHFEAGEKHGKGTYKFKNRIRYVGQYLRGRKQGHGTIYNEDNTVAYSGDFKDGLPNGKGYVIDGQGNQVESIWRDGIDSRLLEV